jgi:ferredoxin-NADP reductase
MMLYAALGILLVIFFLKLKIKKKKIKTLSLMPKIIQSRIQSITYETGSVFTITVVREQEPFSLFDPGQFAMIHLYNPDGSVWKKKPYSMSSSPLNLTSLEFGIKIAGDFTQKMAQLKKGDIIGIEMPYGVFTYKKDIYKNTVMLAGGIGITPFVSMIRYARVAAPKNAITLMYFNVNEKEIAYKKTFDELSRDYPQFSIRYFVDKPLSPEWSGGSGFIDEEKIQKTVSSFEDGYFLMCGPAPFMQTAQKILESKNVPKNHIKREVF